MDARIAYGMTRAALAILEADELSNEWPKCLNDEDSDDCSCKTCVAWAKVLQARKLLREASNIIL